jgi:nucleoside-triphosphatase THEP1
MNRALETADRAEVIEPAFMRRIRLRGQRRAQWIRAQGTTASNLVYEIEAIPHAEIDRILAGADLVAKAEAAFYGEDPVARQLTKAIQLVDLQFHLDESWLRLVREFALSQYELDLLSLVVAVEINPMLRRAYGYLNDDVTACNPTPWLAACLFEWPSAIRFTPESPIIRWRFARPADGVANSWAVQAPWIADAHVVAWIADGQALDPFLAGALALPNRRAPPTICLYPTALAAMRDFVEALLRGSGPRADGSPSPRLEIDLIGAPGSGKRTLVAQLCDALGRRAIMADAGLLLSPEVPLAAAIDNAVRATRTARLSGATLHWHNAEQIDAKLWAIWPRHCGGDLTFFSAATPLGPHARQGAIWRSFVVPPIDRARRIAVWAQHTDAPVPNAVGNRILTPAEIAGAARVAPAGMEAVAQTCRETLRGAAGELFAPLTCPYTWDDIVLEPAVRRHLAELEVQARLRWQVYEEWGFGKLCPLGKGITAMLAGPSGTGKTMAAQVLAGSLGMDLYRIDLAGVVNKYIGETEKRLKQVFEVSERANVLLFFDEADALFGQRTQVKDAHDRYANIEIDYLLQRMEQFDGVAILATNRKSDIDPAFLRRIRFVVDFLPPGPAERLALWRLSLLPAAPGGEPLLDPIDWDLLANRLIMTGADIKSAALGAAFLARAAGTRIGMQQVLYAARREMIKRGVVLRPGEWQE